MWIEIVLLVLSLFLVLYVYITKNYGYFKKRGFSEAEGTFPFGSDPIWKLMLGKVNALNIFDEIVKHFPNSFRQRSICVKDLELAKMILIKDADHFTDRRPSFDADDFHAESD